MPLFRALAKNMAASYFGETALRFCNGSYTSVCLYSVTTQKSISIVFSVSSIRHDSSLSKYRKQKQSPPWTCAIFSISRGGTAYVYGTC